MWCFLDDDVLCYYWTDIFIEDKLQITCVDYDVLLYDFESHFKTESATVHSHNLMDFYT